MCFTGPSASQRYYWSLVPGEQFVEDQVVRLAEGLPDE